MSTTIEYIVLIRPIEADPSILLHCCWEPNNVVTCMLDKSIARITQLPASPIYNEERLWSYAKECGLEN